MYEQWTPRAHVLSHKSPPTHRIEPEELQPQEVTANIEHNNYRQNNGLLNLGGIFEKFGTEELLLLGLIIILVLENGDLDLILVLGFLLLSGF